MPELSDEQVRYILLETTEQIFNTVTGKETIAIDEHMLKTDISIDDSAEAGQAMCFIGLELLKKGLDIGSLLASMCDDEAKERFIESFNSYACGISDHVEHCIDVAHKGEAVVDGIEVHEKNNKKA